MHASTFTGRSALISGGARGLGAHIALALAELGCDVAILDDPDGVRKTLDYPLASSSDAEQVVEGIQKQGRRALLEHVDVRDRAAVSSSVDAALAELPNIDLVVIAAHAGSVIPIDEMTDEAWDDVVETNLHGAFHVLQSVWPHLLEHPGARVVILVPPEARMGAAYRSHYSAAGWATLGMMKSMASEGAPFKVAVNAVCVTATDGPEFAAPRELAFRAGLEPTAPASREDAEHALRVFHPTDEALVDPATVVDSVLFLLGQSSTAMTGSVLEIAQGASTFNAT